MIEKGTSPSVYETSMSENEKVAIALHPRTMGSVLEQVFGGEPGHAEGRPTECRILDAKYEPGNYCRILYEFGDHLVIGTYKWEADEGQIPETTQVIPSLGMQVYRFPNDPALSTLTKVLDSQTVSAALAQTLQEIQNGAARILRCEVTPLRFRPERRCTVRLSLWLRENESGEIYKRVLYGKIYHD